MLVDLFDLEELDNLSGNVKDADKWYSNLPSYLFVDYQQWNSRKIFHKSNSNISQGKFEFVVWSILHNHLDIILWHVKLQG